MASSLTIKSSADNGASYNKTLPVVADGYGGLLNRCKLSVDLHNRDDKTTPWAVYEEQTVTDPSTNTTSTQLVQIYP